MKRIAIIVVAAVAFCLIGFFPAAGADLLPPPRLVVEQDAGVNLLWVELVTGALLVAQAARPVPALVALALMLAFTVLIVRRLAAGEHPPCACFGAWSARPLGWWHVARNLALIGLSVLALL